LDSAFAQDPDQKRQLGKLFLARNDYTANLAIYGKTRRFVIYGMLERSWRVVARIEGKPVSYPSVEILTGATRAEPKKLLIVCWVQNPAGGFVQEKLRDGTQANDELGQHFWQWDCEVPNANPTVDSGLIRFYPRNLESDTSAAAVHNDSPWQNDTQQPNWGLLTIACGYYEKAPSLNASWTAASANAVEDALKGYGPVWVGERIRAPFPNGMTATKLLDELQKQIDSGKSQGVNFFLVYCIGHAAAVQDQDVWLFMGDLDLSDLRRFVRGPIVSADLDLDAPAPSYVLPVGELAGRLRASKIYYALLIDSCFQNAAYEADKELIALFAGLFGIGAESDSFSEGLDGIFSALDQIQYLRKIQALGQVKNRYLSQNDPVIFGAAPGTLGHYPTITMVNGLAFMPFLPARSVGAPSVIFGPRSKDSSRIDQRLTAQDSELN
jgi:hypothetical protein